MPLRRAILAALSAIVLPVSGTAFAAAPSAAAASGPLITEPDDGYQSVYDFINSATTSLDMTMYELVDTTAEQDLANMAAKGVKVRVILDQNREKSSNTSAYNFLSDNGVDVEWADTTYAATHQKTITVDDKTSLVLTGNLTSRYYSTTRDFGVVDTDAADVSAIEAVFNADFADKSVTPGDGDDLVWSPTDSQSQLEKVINGATKTLAVENEEMGYAPIVDDLVAAAKRGVDVSVTMTNTDNDYASEFDTLTSGGVHVATYASDASLYIHAKVILADGATGFIGSENFSNASLNENRELGLITTDSSILSSVGATLQSDYSNATPWS